MYAGVLIQSSIVCAFLLHRVKENRGCLDMQRRDVEGKLRGYEQRSSKRWMRGVGSSRRETKMDGVKCQLRDRDREKTGRERETCTDLGEAL